jgi:hypothetical protein
MGQQRSAFHPGQGHLAPTQAEYICADRFCHSLFRLRQGGGPYIPNRQQDTIFEPRDDVAISGSIEIANACHFRNYAVFAASQC